MIEDTGGALRTVVTKRRIKTCKARRKEGKTQTGGSGRRGGRLPEDDGVVFECLSRAAAPTADQRLRSDSALGGFKSR